MTDAITVRQDGFAEFAFLNKPAWHGLGNELLPTDDATTRRKKAGFDWQIESAAVEFSARSPLDNQEDGVYATATQVVPGRRVLYRSDNQQPLSVVSDVFKVVQPAQVMDYFEELAEKSGFVLETAGTLFGGRKFWALANIGDESCVLDPKDRVKGRLLMATSVDLSLPTTLKFLAERVVCANTLAWGLREKGGTTIKVRHNSEFRPEDVNEKLGILSHDNFEEIMDDFRHLAEAPMSDYHMIEATCHIMEPKIYSLSREEYMKLAETTPVQRIAELAIEGRAIGSELEGANGTAWAWLNAVTQFVDHESSARTIDRRVERAWFGAGNKIKSRAFDLAKNFASTGIIGVGSRSEDEIEALDC